MNDTPLPGLSQPEAMIVIGCLIWMALTVMAWVFILKTGSHSATEHDLNSNELERKFQRGQKQRHRGLNISVESQTHSAKRLSEGIGKQ